MCNRFIPVEHTRAWASQENLHSMENANLWMYLRSKKAASYFPEYDPNQTQARYRPGRVLAFADFTDALHFIGIEPGRDYEPPCKGWDGCKPEMMARLTAALAPSYESLIFYRHLDGLDMCCPGGASGGAGKPWCAEKFCCAAPQAPSRFRREIVALRGQNAAACPGHENLTYTTPAAACPDSAAISLPHPACASTDPRFRALSQWVAHPMAKVLRPSSTIDLAIDPNSLRPLQQLEERSPAPLTCVTDEQLAAGCGGVRNSTVWLSQGFLPEMQAAETADCSCANHLCAGKCTKTDEELRCSPAEGVAAAWLALRASGVIGSHGGVLVG